MSDLLEERGNSIIETSLTELAFIFFFILLAFSALTISSIDDQVAETTKKNSELKSEVQLLTEKLNKATEFVAAHKDMNPQELIQELTLGQEAIEQLKVVTSEKERIQNELEKITQSLSLESQSIEDITSKLIEKERIENELEKITQSLSLESESIEDIARKLTEHQEMIDIIDNQSSGNKSKSELLAQLVQQNSDFKGQNINLRNKLKNLGNGLDHPPCWADSKTGSIEYVFDVIINESSVEYKAGWPESRKKQALENPNIMRIIGLYSKNNDMWLKSQGLFTESEQQKCRHFVRVYDNAKSKNAFKYYLLGVENHFYKYLSNQTYGQL